MRLALIDNTNKTLSVFQGRECLAVFEVDWSLESNPTELILEVLTAEYKDRA